ncbi:phage replisome organizer N-terminal domain-containing protein [Tuberibacillus sp. Marseille-P3662]|uniref:phage replisome organizer N-terminal domain-containing protein n=1 Tax=Tuberibacillus sp. Marseille-P3662 TaxID=1965358 RepID=UPI000A1CF2AC|nr:phage replisome organizer N-terminal domain-containing protein [Tuberibacillus sp. Marseille-P3662]
MSDVKWIKLSTHMFEDEKIKLIEQMPEADTILVIWVKLLSQAGKTNASGYIFLSEQIPYTDEMLATIFNRPVNTVRMALEAFKSFGMIEIDEQSFISIRNWEKHQNVAGMEKIREQTRQRVAKHRNKKQIEQAEKESNVTVTEGNATEGEVEEELDKEREEEKIPYVEIVNYLNSATGSKYRAQTNKTRSLIKARWNEGFRFNDFKLVIEIKTHEWVNDPKMSKFLRPETLFGTKFESYLNQEEVGEQSAVGQGNTSQYEELF